MIKKNKLLIGMVLVLGILLVVTPLVSSAVRSSGRYTQPGMSSFDYLRSPGLGGGVNIYPYFDQEKCEAGQDFIIQVASTGCTPSVIRSDLLEEQDVPVFCPLMATKVNPLIDVEAIDHIRFDKLNYPRGVSTIGFHPANAAVKRSSRQLLNSPILENIGYAVVVLKKQRNESAMPEFVEGDMTAVLRYDTKNSLGIGQAKFYLPVLSDDEWNEDYRGYSFWKGKGYLRAEAVGVDSARVSVFRDKDTRISSKNLNLGKKSDVVQIPGFYCMAGVQLRLDGLKNPDTRARFEVDGEYFEVAERDRFLDNKCNVRSIENHGLTKEVWVGCDSDEGNDRSFKLEFGSEIKFEVNIDGEKTATVGDVLYDYPDGRKVFLGFIGEVKKSGTKFIIPVITRDNDKEDFLNSVERDVVNGYGRYIEGGQKETGIGFIDGYVKVIKLLGVSSASVIGGFVKGSDFAEPIMLNAGPQRVNFFSEQLKESAKTTSHSAKIAINWVMVLIKLRDKDWKPLEHKITDVSFNGFVEAVDKDMGEEFQEYFDSAKLSYEKLVSQFPDEKIDEYGVVKGNTYAEKGLYELIELAFKFGQMETKVEMCDKFKEKYSESDLDIDVLCDEARNSNVGVLTKDIVIDGRSKTIVLKGIYEPEFEDLGVDLKITGENSAGSVNEPSIKLRKNEAYSLSINGEYVELREVHDDYVVLYTEVIEKDRGDKKVEKRIRLELNKYVVLGKGSYRISVNEIHLKQQAEVRVIPDIRYSETEANFSFKIGIEKRAIQLSPEKIESKIENLDKQLEKWTKISDGLDKTVKGLKTACLGTGAALTIKNLLGNTRGKALARQKVMRGEDGSSGWFDTCAKEVEGTSKSVDTCLRENGPQIDRQVDDYTKKMNSVNEELKGFFTEGGDDEEVVKYADNAFGKLDWDNIDTDKIDSDKMEVALNKDGFDKGYYSKEDVRDIQLYSRLAKSGSDVETKDNAQKNLNSILLRIQKSSGNAAELKNFATLSGMGSDNSAIIPIGEAIEIPVTNRKKFRETKYFNENDPEHKKNSEAYAFSVMEKIKGSQHLMIYNEDGAVQKTYNINEEKIIGVNPDSNPMKLTFEKFDESKYKNKILDPKIRYYETEPFKRWPGIVPFDLENGWYAAMRQSVSGNVRAYQESGKLANFYLCNVGENGRIQFNNGVGGDKCTGFNILDGKLYGTFQGLDEGKTKALVQRAIRAVEDAQDGYGKGRSVNVGGASRAIPIGGTMVNTPEVQCQDFMSPSDCHVLFNVCDPVVCPSSRCDLGGNYPVEDVIQTGIIGGLSLCSQNFDGGKGVILPVCLSGVNAGVEGLLSMTESYRSCLDESLRTGQQVGVCDEIHSIYLCEFMWRQAIPFAKLGIPKVLEIVTGQNAKKGGGEYMNVASAWQNVEGSVDYFKNYYGANSYKAFKARSTNDVGTEVCKLSISGTLPASGDFIDGLTEPDSPVQFHARFDEIPFTTATNPAVSQYKVFYHIYAGKDIGSYFRVYLKGGEGTALNYDEPDLRIADGYIGLGEYATETRDFTAAAGYKQLCVSVNAQERCGFKEVSTSFALDYVRDKYLEEQVSDRDITKESECIAGSRTGYSLLNPNLQEGLDEVINPDLYNSGIVRVCSTGSPGAGTDVKDETENARWVPVGYCGDKELKCWLDTSTAKRAISIDSIEDKALGEVTDGYLDMLQKEGNYLTETEYSEFKVSLEEMSEKDDIGLDDKIVEINENYDKVFLTNQKATLTYYLARANKFLATIVKGDVDEKRKDAADASAQARLDRAKDADAEAKLSELYPDLNEVGLDNVMDAKECGDCGKNTDAFIKSTINFCGEEECKAIGTRLGKTCEFDFWSLDRCREEEKDSVSVKKKNEQLVRQNLVSEAKDNQGKKYSDSTAAIEAVVDEVGEKSACHVTPKDLEDGDIVKIEIDKQDKQETDIEVDAIFVGWEDQNNLLGEFCAQRDKEKGFECFKKKLERIPSQICVPIVEEEEVVVEKDTKDRKDITYPFKSDRSESEMIKLINYAKVNFIGNRKCKCGDNCENYVKSFVKFSKENNIPDPLLLLSIMMQENNCETGSSSSSHGLMQINSGLHCGNYGLPSNKSDCISALTTDSSRNIEVGAKIFYDSYRYWKNGIVFNGCSDRDIKYYNWEAAVRGYNGWGCSSNPDFSNQDFYVDEVMKTYNELDNLS